MSIKIMTPDGRAVWDDDLAVEMTIARGEGGTVPLSVVLDHLELIARVPALYGDATTYAVRTALELIHALDD